jgi:hypothetical protein
MRRYARRAMCPGGEDRYCIDRFGDDYRRYMQRVPRVNFVAGVIRLLRQGKMDDKRR